MRPARLAITVVVVLALIAGVAAAAVIVAARAAHKADAAAAQAAAQREVDVSQRRWCDALQLLTATPVPAPAAPATHPAQVTEYRLYRDFVRLRHVFGCR